MIETEAGGRDEMEGGKISKSQQVFEDANFSDYVIFGRLCFPTISRQAIDDLRSSRELEAVLGSYT
jgi:hypothetical protein